MKHRDLIFNPYFLISLILLILNDLALKWYFSNAITGKISDFAGLFILPIFLACLVPKSKKTISAIIGLVFVFWKSSLSTSTIEMLNSLSILQFDRVIDYTDLLALGVLPFSHFLINNGTYRSFYQSADFSFAKGALLLISSFTFLATSISRYEIPEGNVFIGKAHIVKMSKDSILSKIQSLGYDCVHKEDIISSNKYYFRELRYYQIDSLIIKDEEVIFDTLKSLKFYLEQLSPKRTKIELINIEFMEPGNIQNWKYLKSLSRIYNKRIKKGLLNDIKEYDAKVIVK